MSLQNEYQEKWSDGGYKFFQSNKCGMYLLAQRTGKIRTTLLTLNKLFINKQPNILISYPDNKIKESWEKDFIKWNYNNPNITFVNTSSLHKYLNKNVDFFCIDEVHNLSEKQLEEAIQISKNSKYTLGLTGTIDNETIHLYKILFNMDIISKYTTEEAIKDGILSNYQITIHKVPLDTKKFIKNSKGKMVNEAIQYKNYSFVIDNTSNMKAKMNLALARNRLAQKSITRIEYTKNLISNIKGRLIVFCGYEDNAKLLKLPYESSKTGKQTKTKKGNIQAFNDKDFDKLALLQMGKLGVTYNSLDSLILSSWDGNESTLAQTLSRAVLLDYDDKIADIHIITSDEYPELKKLNNVLKQFPQNKIKWK